MYLTNTSFNNSIKAVRFRKSRNLSFLQYVKTYLQVLESHAQLVVGHQRIHASIFCELVFEALSLVVKVR